MNDRPLKLTATPFEWYMLEDDTAKYPMVFTSHYIIQGELNLELMLQAFKEALLEQPLLRSRAVRTNDQSRYAWEVQSETECCSTLVFGPSHFTTVSSTKRIDPFDGPNCRLSLKQITNPLDKTVENKVIRYLVSLQFHHAVTDGIGSFEFCSDFFNSYIRLFTKQTDNNSGLTKRRVCRKAISTDLLIERGMLDRRIPHPVKASTAYLFLAKELVKFFFAFPARIRRIRYRPFLPEVSTRTREFSEIQHHDQEALFKGECDVSGIEISGEIVDVLRRYAQSHGGTLNHILLAATFRAFSKMHTGKFRFAQPWVAVLPVNMRRATKQRIPAHNGIGYAFIRRSQKACLDWYQNFESLKTEFDAIQDWKLAALFVDALDFIRRFPRWLARRIVRNMSPGSFVWSYIGDPFRRFPQKLVEKDQVPQLAQSEITDFFAAPPTRPGTETSILVTLWQDSVRLWFRFDRRRINPEQAMFVRHNIAAEIVLLAREIQSATLPRGDSDHD